MRLCPLTPLQVGSRTLGGSAPLVCVPLVGADDAAFDAELDNLSRLGPDIIELRVDAWDCVEDTPRALERLRRGRGAVAGLPVILTCRGHWEGGVKPVADEAKFALYRGAVREGLVDLVDIELWYGKTVIGELRAELATTPVALIVSAHDFAKTPPRETLWRILQDEVKAGAQVAKLAAMPQCEEDVLNMLEVSLAFRRAWPHVPLITMSMGTLGAVSRLAGGCFGSDLTFAVGSVASAPGQMPLSVLREVFPTLYG